MKRILSACKKTREEYCELRLFRTKLFLGHGFVLYADVADRSELTSDCSILLADVISLCLYGKTSGFFIFY